MKPSSFHEEPEPGEVWVDPSDVEELALDMARDIILTQLKQAGLPAPPNLDQHATELLAARPSIREQAAARVKAREKVKAGILDELGLIP